MYGTFGRHPARSREYGSISLPRKVARVAQPTQQAQTGLPGLSRMIDQTLARFTRPRGQHPSTTATVPDFCANSPGGRQKVRPCSGVC
jgi:hypothetical protein